MSNPFSNKKKIRNWKRQTKRVTTWKESHLTLDMDYLLQSNSAYVKIWIDPWYRLTRRNPPLWLARKMYEGLCEIYISWKKQLDELNEPYYLKIWLFDPWFINSQVVAAIRDDINFYSNTFNPPQKVKVFPEDRFSSIVYTGEFNWSQYLDEDFYFEKFDDLSEIDIRELIKKAHIIEQASFEGGKVTDTCYRINKGDVWVGSMKK